MSRARALLGVPVLLVVVTACATAAKPPELSEQQICLSHFENDPVEQARCRLDPALRDGTPPDADPRQLPLDTGAPR